MVFWSGDWLVLGVVFEAVAGGAFVEVEVPCAQAPDGIAASPSNPKIAVAVSVKNLDDVFTNFSSFE